MYAADEGSPHRGPSQLPDAGHQSLYDSIDPFSENRLEDEQPWGPPPADGNGENGDDSGEEAEPGTASGQWSQAQAPSESALHPSELAVHPSESAVHPSEPAMHIPPPALRFTVGQVVDRSRRSPTFSFEVATNLGSYKARKYTGVERNQIEFERLEAHLRATYPECLVPTLGPGTTVSKYVPDFQNDRLVVVLLQQWMNRVAVHPILRQDYELRQFVEAPFAFNPALASSGGLSATSSQQGSGFFSWGRPKQRVVARSANPTPFEQQLESTSENIGAFQRNIADARQWHGRLARTRARLAVDLRDVGTKMVSVGVIEHNARLGRSLKRMGKCFLHLGACAHTQSNLEGSRPIAVEDIYTNACDNVQRTLANRQVIFTEHQVAERQLERKRQTVAVLRASASIDPAQAQETLTEFNTAKADADAKRQRADRVDRVLAADLQAFETNREGDFRTMFSALGRDQLHIERQALSELRAVLDFVRHTGPTAPASGSTAANPTATPTAVP
ncbi:Vacuolar protein sorting-associated protein 17 [Coemansia sp. RSA 552]|nr:Vacuolar protein sorting-associated protein 17 [Coemansia sp. RSA 552]